MRSCNALIAVFLVILALSCNLILADNVLLNIHIDELPNHQVNDDVLTSDILPISDHLLLFTNFTIECLKYFKSHYVPFILSLPKQLGHVVRIFCDSYIAIEFVIFSHSLCNFLITIQ